MKALAVIAAILGLGWLVLRKPKRKKTRPPITVMPPKPPPPKGAPFVGSGWTDWPHKDQFPDEKSFGQSLELLDYNPGSWSSPEWTILDEQALDAVTAFQMDFNILMAFRRHMRAQGQEFEPGSPPVRPDLASDSLLGQKTITALADAFVYERVAGMKWDQIVQTAAAEFPVA